MEYVPDILNWIGDLFLCLSIICALVFIEAGLGVWCGKMIKAGRG